MYFYLTKQLKNLFSELTLTLYIIGIIFLFNKIPQSHYKLKRNISTSVFVLIKDTIYSWIMISHIIDLYSAKLLTYFSYIPLTLYIFDIIFLLNKIRQRNHKLNFNVCKQIFASKRMNCKSKLNINLLQHMKIRSPHNFLKTMRLF